MPNVIFEVSIMLSVANKPIMLCHYAECHYAECRLLHETIFFILIKWSYLQRKSEKIYTKKVLRFWLAFNMDKL
jgi:hypothetical protein